MPLLDGLFLVVFFDRHLSEQYFTSSQFFSHFFRHVNGRLQTMQILVGRSDFFTPFTVLFHIIQRKINQRFHAEAQPAFVNEKIRCMMRWCFFQIGTLWCSSKEEEETRHFLGKE
jgi:hypothetical protein